MGRANVHVKTQALYSRVVNHSLSEAKYIDSPGPGSAWEDQF